MLSWGKTQPKVSISEPYGFLPTFLVGGVADFTEFGTISRVPEVPCSLSQGKRVLASTHVYTPRVMHVSMGFPVCNTCSVSIPSLRIAL